MSSQAILSAPIGVQGTRRMTDRSAVFYALGALPLCDCIADQLNNGLHLMLGPVTLLQALHGSLMIVFATLCVLCALENPARVRAIPIPVYGAFLFIAIVVSKELASTGSLAMASVAAYGQMIYWILFWTVAAMLCDEAWKATKLLWGLAAGALGTAFSVFLGFALGAQNFYQGDAVDSSAGWFDTAKMITGVLVTGGIVLLYLGRGRKGWLYPLLACFCFAACIMTYARAGVVALGAVLLWMPVWGLTAARRGERRWIARFLLLAVLAGGVGAATLGNRLFARWSDVKQGDQAGSGRATFWKMAAERYVEATAAQQTLGRGYNGMSEMLFDDYGMDIKHTHNDLLDMLTVGGLAGAVWLMLLVANVLWRAIRSPLSSVEGGASIAIVLAYLLHGQFTGQLWGTDAMSYYMVSLACLATLSPRSATERIDSPGCLGGDSLPAAVRA